MVKYLIEKGSDKDAKEKDGWTPLHIAIMNGHFKVAQFLFEKETVSKVLLCLIVFVVVFSFSFHDPFQNLFHDLFHKT